MKKLLMILAMILFFSNTFAQKKSFAVIEFMKVDASQDAEYLETENFWEKIHKQRIKDGHLKSWELWTLKPGGEDQGYQYLTISTYDNRVKMFADWGDIGAVAQKVHPKLSKEEVLKKLANTENTRDLAVRYYLELLDKTDDKYDYPIGTVATITMMKVNSNNFSAYEKAESEFFKPMHQAEIENDQRSSWKLYRFVSPTGSDTYASHITMNVYKDYAQVFSVEDEDVSLSEDQQKSFDAGISLREMKYVHMATLLKKVK
ncbi:MAG: hypothetical protein HKN90_00545 [Flavobacteriaceae bacterium]|nr:hypothetical protein [Flavobacteriaceae bacterium]